jgi:ureidoglycolate lyase
MTERIVAAPLTAAAFAPFGQVLEAAGAPDRIINRGLCGRWHDLARLDFESGRAGISLFRAEPRRLPLVLDLVERHPLGSQAFVPMTADPFLVVVAPDDDANGGGRPGAPLAFLTAPGQGVNFARGIWHGVLTPLSPPGLFAVIDRIEADSDRRENLEEYPLDPPWLIEAP